MSGAQGSATTDPDHPAGRSDDGFISNFRPEAQGEQPDQHEEDFLNQEEPAVKDFSVRALGFAFNYDRSEDHTSRSVFMCMRRQRSPEPTPPRTTQETQDSCCSFLSRPALTRCRWGLTWQTLPHSGEVCWALSSHQHC